MTAKFTNLTNAELMKLVQAGYDSQNSENPHRRYLTNAFIARHILVARGFKVAFLKHKVRLDTAPRRKVIRARLAELRRNMKPYLRVAHLLDGSLWGHQYILSNADTEKVIDGLTKALEQSRSSDRPGSTLDLPPACSTGNHYTNNGERWFKFCPDCGKPIKQMEN